MYQFQCSYIKFLFMTVAIFSFLDLFYITDQISVPIWSIWLWMPTHYLPWDTTILSFFYQTLKTISDSYENHEILLILYFVTKYSELFQILMIVMFCEHFFPKGYYIPFLQKQIFFTSAKALFLSELLELSSSFCLPVEKLVSRDFEKNPTDRQTNPIISSFLVLKKQHL